MRNIIKEIEEVMVPKLFNIEHGSATEREIQVVKECQGFISLLRYSCLREADIKQLWDNSGLKYQ